MGFPSKFTKETHWKPIETQFWEKIKHILIFKMIFLHDKIIFFIQNFFYDLEFSYTFDLAHS